MFTATKWSSVEDKEKFLKSLKRFVSRGYKRTMFTKAMYNRLNSNSMFGHIAHFNIEGFYQEWFTVPSKWEKYVLSRPIYGDPAWTYSDVEKEFQEWLEHLTQ